MCCSCGMCYDYLRSDHNITLDSRNTLNMSSSCGDTCVKSGGFCYEGTCYSYDECKSKCDDADCDTCFCGTCLGRRARESELTVERSYFVDASLASGGLAAVCLLGVLGRWSLKTIKNRQYEKLNGSTKGVRETPMELSQDEMCYQNFKISPDLNVSQVYF